MDVVGLVENEHHFSRHLPQMRYYMVLSKERLVFLNTRGKTTFKEISKDLGVQEHQVYVSNQMSLF